MTTIDFTRTGFYIIHHTEKFIAIVDGEKTLQREDVNIKQSKSYFF